jgi:hypothetical protein
MSITNQPENTNENPKSTIVEANTAHLSISLSKNVKKSVFFQLFCCNFSNYSKADQPNNMHVCLVCQNKLPNLCSQIKQSRYFKSSYYTNNCAFYLFIFVYIIIQTILVIIQMVLYKQENSAVLVARAAGILLSFNMVFVLFLVLRSLITWLRSTNIGRKCLPSDDFLDFHKYIGVFILILSILHTMGHCINLCEFFFLQLF